MNEAEILEELSSLKILPKYYSIGYEIKDYAYNIERLADGRYAYYYLERAEKIGYQVYDNKVDALAKMIKALKSNLIYKIDLTK